MSPPSATFSDKSICRLCGRQFAKYNCPTCNVAYCSLTCFRSEAHAQCSETFYKKEVETQIQSEPSKTLQERMQMMEMLKKFEEESEQDAGLDSDGEDDGEDLARRFADIDLDATSVADVWSKLTPAEQAEFVKIMEDPNSDHARQLLASEELENERCEPWWHAPAVESDGPLPRRYGSKPELIPVPAVMVQPIPNGPLLHYNICAVCIAYAFVTRHLSVSPLSSLLPEDIDFEEAKHLVSQLVPFLVDRKSTMLHPNLSSLVTDIWSRFKPGQVSSDLFAILLKDTTHMVCPLPVTAVALRSESEEYFDVASHPHLNLVLALSDLTKLFQCPTTDAKKSHVTYKLLFYAAHILSTPSDTLRVLAEELAERSAAYQTDRLELESEFQGGTGKYKRQEGRVPVIEEVH
ncbi:Zinc finger HIT domain-containing protein 2 [Termitomyces sp. T112]|nr:Zinc finger HIT domain-containing protein 2 [Termitomyces sp. T112]